MNATGKQNDRDDTQLSEEDATCVVFRPFYGWVNAFLARGWRRHRRKELIEVEDLLRLPQSEEAEHCYNVFQPAWLLELERYHRQCEQEQSDSSKEQRRKKKTPLPRLFRVLLKVYKWEVLLGGLCRLLGDGCMLATPFIFRELVGWLQRYAAFDETSTTSPSEPPKWEGFVYSIVLFISVFMLSFLHNASLYYTASAFCKMRNSVALSVFEKSLRLHCDHGLTGVAIQLHTSDANKFVDSALFFHQMWSSPLFILAALIALYDFVGWSGVISIGIMLAFLPVQVISTSYMTKLRGVAARLADRRLASLNEMLLGIRIVKFMRWEKPLTERILRVRQVELKNLIWIQFFRSVMTTLTSIQPVIVFLCVFLIAWGLDEPITPVSVFPTFAMLNLLRLPLGQLPLSFARFVDLVIALRRLTVFLIAPEKVTYIKAIDRDNNGTSNEPFATSNSATECAIIVENLCVRYTDTHTEEKNKTKIKAHDDVIHAQFIIQDVNLLLPRGKLTMVIGPTGSGKSTLLTALMGEASVTPESRVVVDGTFAYVPQEAWIMNDTVRNNIIMNRPYDEAHYLRTVRSCQLVADLHQMQNSDQTEIGESGVNMSGGQKQRVAFARAVYSDRDVYIMDDPLSAVDSHVSLALLENCVCGALAGKTRLLVTHQVQYLPRADYVVVMAGCRVRFQGTYEELLLSGLDIAAAVEGSPKETESEEKKQKDEVDPQTEKEAKEEHKEEHNAIPPPSMEKSKGMMTVEKQQQGSIRCSTFALYYQYQGILVVFFTVVTFLVWRAVLVFSDLLFSWWSVRQPVLNYTLDDQGYAIWLSITIAVCFVLQGIRQIPFIAGTVFCARYNFEHMLLRLVKAPTSFFDTTPFGRIAARFSKDVEVVDLIIPDTLNLLYHMVLIILGSFALLVYAGPYNIILVIIMCGGFALAFVYFSPSNRSLKRLEAVTRSPMASIIAQTLGGLATIRAYDCSSLFKAPHTAAVNVAARTTYTWRSTLRWMSLRIDTLSAFITLGTSLVSCGLMISADSSSRTELLPVMALAISHSLNFVTAMNVTANILAEFESSFSSIERCKEYADEVPQEHDIATYSEEHPPPPPRWPEHGAVEFSNVCMRYAPDKPLVLKHINVRIEAGHKVGIVGRTGSGKSTIMLALFRMVEIESGAISIDGVNINAVTIDDLRNSLTIIPQDPMLFAGTIRSNLDPFSRFTDEQVWHCIRTVGLEERVRGKSFNPTEEAGTKQGAGTGLDAPVAERGSNFSVGQRQLLCLARALLKECKVLLLDEATASVDYESDALIQRTIQHAFAHCTVLTIAHRLATIIHSDRVLVLNQGVVAEYDSPAALLEKKEGQLYNMVAALGPEQFKQLQRAANSVSIPAT